MPDASVAPLPDAFLLRLHVSDDSFAAAMRAADFVRFPTTGRRDSWYTPARLIPLAMKIFTRFGHGVALCLAALTPLCHCPAASAQAKGTEAAKAQPSLQASLTIQPPELSPASTIELIFPTPMVAKDRIGSRESDPPLTVRPELKGTFEWVSTRSGLYRLTENPKFSTSYEFRLREGLKDLTGSTVTASLLASANSAKFRLIDQHPKWFDTENARRVPQFLFEFNADVDAQSAVSALSFVSEEPSLTVPAKVRHATGQDYLDKHAEPQPTWSEEIAKTKPELPKEATRLSALVVEPAEPLPVATKWRLVIADTLTDASGRGQIAQGDQVHLGDVKPFSVRKITAHTPFDRPYYLQIEFNKSLLPPRQGEWTERELAVIAEKAMTAVRVEPPVTPTKVEVLGSGLRVHGGFGLNTPYHVVVDPWLSSGDGLPLSAPGDAQVTFVPNAPYVAAPAYLRAQLAKGEGAYEFIAANVQEVRVRVKRLNGAELLQATDKYQSYVSTSFAEEKKQKGFIPEPIDAYTGTPIYDHTFKVQKPLDQSELIKLNWRDILKESPAAPLFVELRGTAADGLPQKGIVTQTLVQFTDLGLMQKSNGKETLVFVTSLQTGKPVAGARLTMVDAEHKLLAYADTDASGVARLTGIDPAFVMAEKNGDCTVIQCEDAHIGGAIPYDIPQAWEPVWKPQRKTFLFSDRPLYRPGDLAHFKAHTRLLTGDDLSLDTAPVSARAREFDAKRRPAGKEP